MYKLRKFIKNCDGVSEVMGQVLLIGLVVIFFSFIGVFVFSYNSPDDIPHADLQVWMDETSDTVYLKHRGGEALSGNEIKVVVMVNGTRNEFSPENVSAKLGVDGVWEIGDVIEIGIPIENGDTVNLFLIHTPSNNVIQKMDVIAS
jgi:FlaG/FlaF family flagellin (archaellin)